MFTYLYLSGLVIGLIVYSITYLFVKDMIHWRRALVVMVIGFLFLFGSLFIIGGFAGMPYGVLSLGIITIAILFLIFGKGQLGKKIIYTVVILSITFCIAFISLNKVDYWIVKKTHYASGGEVSMYIEELQQDPTIQGYKTFTISEGNQGVVLSLGEKMAGNNIEVLNVEENYGTTEIKIRTFYNQSNEQNPVIMIGLDRVQNDIIIMDTDGTIYEEATKME